MSSKPRTDAELMQALNLNYTSFCEFRKKFPGKLKTCIALLDRVDDLQAAMVANPHKKFPKR